MNTKYKIVFIFITSILIIYSCSTARYVPDNEYLLSEARVKVDAKDISPFDLDPYIKQKANYKTFEVFQFPLFVYNLSGKDSTKWYNKTLRNAGEPPVIYDSTQIDRTVNQLSMIMENKGYNKATIEPVITKGDKKVKVIYDIKVNDPTRIANYTINISDTVFDSNVIKNAFPLPKRVKQRLGDSVTVSLDDYLSYGKILKKGDQMDLDLLDSERERVTSILNRNGYMDFNKDYIEFIADTIGKKNEVDLEMIIYPYNRKLNSQEIVEEPHRQYYLDNVDIYVDYDPIADGSLSHYQATDTIQRGNYRIFYGPRGRYIKPFVILNNCFIEPGKLYDGSQVVTTYNALSQLNILKNVSIKYEQYLQNDSIRMRCIITAVPDKKQGISSEIEGTNSSGFFGIGTGLGYTHRNIFKGSELLNIKAKGSYEAVTPNFSNFKDNYFEVGAEMSLTFPQFMFPFLDRDLRRKLRASTQFTSSYTYQRRPGYFTRTVFATGVKYTWENRTNNRDITVHTFDLIDISYAHIPELSKKFEEQLTTNAKIYSFTDQFILSTGYTFYRSNNLSQRLFYASNKKNRSFYSMRASIETAGNVLGIIAKLTNAPKDEYKSRKIFDTYYAQYIKGNFDYSKSIQLDQNSSFAWRLGGGLVYPYGNNEMVPFQKRFFSGGANSVRGWSARELGPGSFFRSDANFNDQSGDIRFDANAEYRSKAFWKLEFATFLDAGNIWTIKGTDRQYKGEFKIDKFYKQIASAWGLGIRLDLDFVLIRLDCGWKIYNPADIPIFKKDDSGYQVIDGYESKWAILHPFKFRQNTAWHIAVGYPF